MGREIRRVPQDFDQPLGKVWEGFVNPWHDRQKKCPCCDGSGYSEVAKDLSDTWYGHGPRPFRPEMRGSIPFLPSDRAILAVATRNVERSPEHYGTGQGAIQTEARRLCGHFNASWCHHLNDDDVKALLDAKRLLDFTHDWTKGKGWHPKVPAVVPTAREVNEWSIMCMGHDAINQSVVVEAECKRLGVERLCSECHGDGTFWPNPEDEKKCEAWKPTEPPAGECYQLWETVSEGSPISPPFATPEGLAAWLASPAYGRSVDKGITYESWLSFIKGPGYAPSFVSDGQGNLVSGVEALATQEPVEPEAPVKNTSPKKRLTV